MEKIKQVLVDALRNITNRGNGFICHAIDDVNNYDESKYASKKLIKETLDYFKRNRPTAELHTKYFNQKQFMDGYSWWNFTEGQRKYSISLENRVGLAKRNKYDGKITDAIEKQRRKFLKYLISTI